METLSIRCGKDPSRPSFGETERLSAWTEYRVSVRSDRFRGDSGRCLLWIESETGTELASCRLDPDPLRGDVRLGVLLFGDSSHAGAVSALGTGTVGVSVRCSLQGGTVFSATVPADLSPSAWKKGV